MGPERVEVDHLGDIEDDVAVGVVVEADVIVLGVHIWWECCLTC